MKWNAEQVGILFIPNSCLKCTQTHLPVPLDSYIIKDIIADFLVFNGIWRETRSNRNIKTVLMFWRA